MPSVLEHCFHPRLIPGLDSAHCPDCKSSFTPRSPEYKSVLEQSLTTAQNPVPEHSSEQNGNDTARVLAVPEHSRAGAQPLQWTERYSVKRGLKVHLYYRYVWMQDRKFHHHHIPGGNTRSPRALVNLGRVEGAIASGKSPHEVEQMLRTWGKG